MNQQPTARGSRYRRPAEPKGLWLQPRDVDVLRVLQRFKYLRSDHVHVLLFAGVSFRIAQHRLRKLWEHDLVGRLVIPIAVSDGENAPPHSQQQIYFLTPAGAALVADEVVGKTRLKRLVPMTIAHHLVAVDFLVAVIVASRGTTVATLVEAKHETELWPMTRHYRGVGRKYLVPDALFTLSEGDKRRTFFIEVVRANVRGGNQTLRKKMNDYLEALPKNIFGELYGIEKLVAVLFLTTSEKRAKNLRAVAGGLGRGKNLFWFGAYGRKDQYGRTVSTLQAENIFTPRWSTADGKPRSFLIPNSKSI
jgi:hypothetical protein